VDIEGSCVSRGAQGDPSPEMFLLFDLKVEHFGAVFKLDLTEEPRAQLLQEEETIASSCRILAGLVVYCLFFGFSGNVEPWRCQLL